MSLVHLGSPLAQESPATLSPRPASTTKPSGVASSALPSDPRLQTFHSFLWAAPVWDASWILWFHWVRVTSREATWVLAAAQTDRFRALWLGARPCCGQGFVLFIIGFIWPQKGQRERVSKLGRVCARVHECVNLSL